MAVTPLALNSESKSARNKIDTEIQDKETISTHSEIVAELSEDVYQKAPSPMDCTVLHVE